MEQFKSEGSPILKNSPVRMTEWSGGISFFRPIVGESRSSKAPIGVNGMTGEYQAIGKHARSARQNRSAKVTRTGRFRAGENRRASHAGNMTKTGSDFTPPRLASILLRPVCPLRSRPSFFFLLSSSLEKLAFCPVQSFVARV